MLYSCFDASRGEYKIFKDDANRPANSDLPVPALKSLVAGTIGVPAMDAGRPLPSGAEYAGYAPNAHGMVVNCDVSLSGFGEISPTVSKVIGIGILVLAAYGAFKLVF